VRSSLTVKIPSWRYVWEMVPAGSNSIAPSPKSHLLESPITGRLLVSVKRTTRGGEPDVTFAVKSILDAPSAGIAILANIRRKISRTHEKYLSSSG